MISVDANILIYSYVEASPHHAAARAFLDSLSSRGDVLLSEFILTEFYLHLRNPAILGRPLSAPAAAAVIQSFRHHPRWRVAGFPAASSAIHDTLWRAAAGNRFARRRIYDLRTALCLQAFGVTEFATANVKDFEGVGFSRVWDPATSPPVP